MALGRSMCGSCGPILWLWALLLTLPALAQVQALKQQPGSVTLGTDRFSLTVEASGTLRAIKSGETVLFPFVGIYSNPTSTEDDKPVRCCQAESPGLGDRPPQMDTVFADGNATVTITRDCSHPKLYNNEPIWRLRETVLVQPDGLVRVTYNCRFLRYLYNMSWTAVFAAAMPEFTGRTWQARVPDLTLNGVIPTALPKRDDLAGAWELLLESSRGPLKVSFGKAGRVEMGDWGQYLEIGASLPALPHSGPLYRGVEQEITVSLQLPIKP
jgi:hypothetical protein